MGPAVLDVDCRLRCTAHGFILAVMQDRLEPWEIQTPRWTSAHKTRVWEDICFVCFNNIQAPRSQLACVGAFVVPHLFHHLGYISQPLKGCLKGCSAFLLCCPSLTLISAVPDQPRPLLVTYSAYVGPLKTPFIQIC